MYSATRLDHVIAEVSDIHAAMAMLLAKGYPEAWPIGPFWPSALTCGIAVGGFNLELMQSEPASPSASSWRSGQGEEAMGDGSRIGVAESFRFRITTLVFEPTSLMDAAKAIGGNGLDYEVRDKVEPNPELLRLRGFSGEQSERICTNLIPLDPPFPFFYCDYAPFLKDRLSPNSFDVPRDIQIRHLVYGLARYDESMSMIEALGLQVPPLEFVRAERDGAEMS